jgi:hypothetical protein
LTVAAFETRLDFLDLSQIDEVRLLGGEPTLHPQFVELVALARARKKKITVFSNGLIPERALSCLEAIPATECAVLVNVNEPTCNGKEAHARRLVTLQRLKARALLGFNIYRGNFHLEFLLPIIAAAGCQPAIRLGVAHPCLAGVNEYVRPSQYAYISEQIVRFARQAADAGVRLEFDCGFVRCMFSDADVQMLQTLGADIGWRCNPILDIDLADRVIHCFPMSDFVQMPLTAEVDAPAIRRTFEARTRHYRQSGIFRECFACPFKQSGECPGGCLAATLRRFHNVSFRSSALDKRRLRNDE